MSMDMSTGPLAEEYYQFKKGLNEKGIIFSFTGYVSEKILFALGEAVRRKLKAEEADPGATKKVFSVFVEQVQNIIRYSSERITQDQTGGVVLSSGVITVGREGGRFFVVCGNELDKRRKEVLKEKLEYLSGLDKPALKAYYKEMLKAPPEEDSQGANIGLIEIARRSSEPVEYGFLDLESGNSFFCLKAYI